MYGGSGGLASRPSRTTSEERTGIHKMGGWLDPRASLDNVAKKKVLSCWESNPGHPSHNLVTILTQLPRCDYLTPLFQLRMMIIMYMG